SDYKIPASVDTGEFIPDSIIPTPTASGISAPPSVVAKTSSQQINPLIVIFAVIGVIGMVIIGIVLLSNNSTTTATDTPSDIQMVEAVIAPDLMVLIGEFDNVGTTARDVGRFIYDDLQNKFERDVPFSRIRVRLYPDVIRTSEQAERIAQANNAAVIIWGNYDEQGVTANIQIGSLAPFNNYILSLDETRRFTNVQAELTSERRESLAVNILAIFNVVQTYNNNPYEVGRNLAILELVNTGMNVQVGGNSIAAHWHRYFALYNTDEQASLHEINEAIRLDTGVAVLYSARALTYSRLRQFDNMIQDIRTAQSISPDNFWAEDMLLAQYYFMIADTPNLDEAIVITQNYLTDIPDDWWVNTLLGGIYWQQGDLQNAQPILENAITLAPDANYPYVMLISIYMRQGELGKAQELINFVRQNFPDATIASRIMNATYGLDGVGLTYASEIFSYFILGQWNNVLQIVEKADFDVAYTDAYALAGLAECNLRNYEQAEAYYTRVLDRYPDYLLVYLLRAEVRLKQQNAGGALADIAVINQSDMAERFAPLIAQAQDGELSCETILETDFSDF
ncbi:MAG: tetratricopeptide repeat protein, partial [Anaerolineae bacterium]|nr:tetratricopeptide repeat protein [Anaerolineae bacterium]